jgi:hypothetical protein
MSLALWSATNRNLCTLSKAINSAPAPAGKGDPAIVERLPEEFTANAEIVPEPELVINAKLVVFTGVAVVIEGLPDMAQLCRNRRITADNKKVKPGIQRWKCTRVPSLNSRW